MNIAKIGRRRFFSTNNALTKRLSKEIQAIHDAGTYKNERVITSAQDALISVQGVDKPVLNFCANNYLGLSNHPIIVKAAMDTLMSHGFGLSSVRFICGTQVRLKMFVED